MKRQRAEESGGRTILISTSTAKKQSNIGPKQGLSMSIYKLKQREIKEKKTQKGFIFFNRLFGEDGN